MRTVCTKLRNDDFEKLSSHCAEQGISVSEQLRRLIFSNFKIDNIPKQVTKTKKSENIQNALTLTKNLIKFNEFELAKLNRLTKKLSDDKTKFSLLEGNINRITQMNNELDALRIISKQLSTL